MPEMRDIKDCQPTERTEQSVFDAAAERSRDYTNVVIGHAFQKAEQNLETSCLEGIIKFLVPTLFASSPKLIGERYIQARRQGGDK